MPFSLISVFSMSQHVRLRLYLVFRCSQIAVFWMVMSQNLMINRAQLTCHLSMCASARVSVQSRQANKSS